MFQDDSDQFKTILTNSKRFWPIQNDSDRIKTIQDDSHQFKTILTNSNRFWQSKETSNHASSSAGDRGIQMYRRLIWMF